MKPAARVRMIAGDEVTVDQEFERKERRRGGASVAAAVIFTVAATVGARAWARPIGAVRGIRFARMAHAVAGGSYRIALENSGDDDKDVPTSQVNKYIAVYKAMQKNHSLNVEQAAASQGLTISKFRALEGKIEQNDTLREQVRRALRGESGEKGSTDE